MDTNSVQTAFKLTAPYEPSGDQPEAIHALTEGFSHDLRSQVLVGVTGSGKTYTMANVIRNLNRPTLIISHNKTLAAQLYQEFKEFFPDNAVSYFVSYYDYYQPEAYIPSTDTYIEKETEINEDIDKLRLAATMNILTRKDTIVVASVSAIYNIGSPREYGQFVLELQTGMATSIKAISDRLVTLQYERNDWEFNRGKFRVRGSSLDLSLAYDDKAIRFTVENGILTSIEERHPVDMGLVGTLPAVVVYPSKHYMTDPKTYKKAFEEMQNDLDAQVKLLKSQNKLLEAHRLQTRVEHDIDMIREVGYVNGIENYSRYFDGRKAGDPPFTLLDYFQDAGNPWLLMIDESHMTIPQIRGMYNGDRSRKQTLIDFGFRLPASLDNRPMTFDEFQRRQPQTLYVSATPDEWELSTSDAMVEQLVRPTGLLDPLIEIRKSDGQIADIEKELIALKTKGQRALITTLTKQMAEDLSAYLKEHGIRVTYLHSDIETLVRTETLKQLRLGEVDVLIGVNLLREGIDLPEVSLVIILDADKQGFLRSRTSLVQTMGRAARHISGSVILYADRETDAIRDAVAEVTRRRAVQVAWNERHGVTPTTINKPIRENIIQSAKEARNQAKMKVSDEMPDIESDMLTPADKAKAIAKLTISMRQASKNLDFERAAVIRDTIKRLKDEIQ
jgi:excinuclease ABC subunit B